MLSRTNVLGQTQQLFVLPVGPRITLQQVLRQQSLTGFSGIERVHPCIVLPAVHIALIVIGLALCATV
jgi:hypothetical protein